MPAFAFRAQAFSRSDTVVSVDDDSVTLTSPRKPTERIALSAISSGSLVVSDNPGSVGQTSYLNLIIANRKPLKINSTSPSAKDGGASEFDAFLTALVSSLAAGGRPNLITAGSSTLAWLGIAFFGVLGVLAIFMVALIVASVVGPKPEDAAAPGIFLFILLCAMPAGVRMCRANKS